MSEPNKRADIFPSSDPSGDFGRDEGITGYALLALDNPDGSVGALAERAVRLQMVATGRFDVGPTRAAEAVVEFLQSGFEVSDINTDTGAGI